MAFTTNLKNEKPKKLTKKTFDLPSLSFLNSQELRGEHKWQLSSKNGSKQVK
jgi:hypothetical protein